VRASYGDELWSNRARAKSVDLGRIGRALSGCSRGKAKEGKKAISHHFGAAEATIPIYRSQDTAHSSPAVNHFICVEESLALALRSRISFNCEGLPPFLIDKGKHQDCILG
jgi:hypothetical protein